MISIFRKCHKLNKFSQLKKLKQFKSRSCGYSLSKRHLHRSFYLFDSKSDPIKDDDSIDSHSQKNEESLDINNDNKSFENKQTIEEFNKTESNDVEKETDTLTNPFRKLKKRVVVNDGPPANEFVSESIDELRKTIYNVIAWSGVTPAQKNSPLDDPTLTRLMNINVHSFLNETNAHYNKIGISLKAPIGYSNAIYEYLKRYSEDKECAFLLLDMPFLRKTFNFFYEKKIMSSFNNRRIGTDLVKILHPEEETSLIFEEFFNVLDEKYNDQKKFIIAVKDFEIENEKLLFDIRNLIRVLGKPIVFINIDTNTKKDPTHIQQFVNYVIKEKEKGVYSIEPMNVFKRLKKVMNPRELQEQQNIQQKKQQQQQLQQNKESNLSVNAPLGFDVLDISGRILDPLYKDIWDKNEEYHLLRSNLFYNLKMIGAYLKILNIHLSHYDSMSDNKYLWSRVYDWDDLRKVVLSAMKIQMMENVKRGEPLKSITHLDVNYLNEAFYLNYGLSFPEMEDEMKESVDENKNKSEDITYTSAEQKIMKNIVEADKIETTFEDIGSLIKAKEELMSLLIPLKMKAFKSNNLITTPTGILLYGPPGTGKTMLARALAKTANAFFIHISASTILSKWLGESEENVSAIFSLAKKRSPSIIFIDEVDGLLQARDTSDHESSRRVKNEFFSSWDGLLSKEENADVTVICATNRPFDLDSAALRRLPHRVLVPLPDPKSRRDIFEKCLKNIKISTEHTEEEVSEEERKQLIDKLSEITEKYSGSDIKSVCVRAALQLVRDFMNENEYNDLLKNEESIESLENIAMKYATRPITMKEFNIALKEIAPSVDPKGKTQLELSKWHQTYGHTSDKKKQHVTLGF